MEELNIKKHKILNYQTHSSFIKNKSIIYFFRRLKSTYKFFKYDFLAEQQLSVVSIKNKEVEFQMQNEEIEKGVIIKFAQIFGEKVKKKKDNCAKSMEDIVKNMGDNKPKSKMFFKRVLSLVFLKKEE